MYILIYHLGEVTPQRDGVPLSVLGALVSLAVEDALARSKAYACYLNACLQATHLGLHAHISYKYNFVYHSFMRFLLIKFVGDMLLRILIALYSIVIHHLFDILDEALHEVVALGALYKAHGDGLVVHSAHHSLGHACSA